MKSTDRLPRRMARAGLMLCAVFVSMQPHAANDMLRSQAQLRYQQERAACLNGKSQQNPSACLREASAALAEALRGGLTGDPDEALANQRRRCDPLPPADRDACIARMTGQGTRAGSAAGGGIYREITTPDPAASGSIPKDAAKP